MAKEETATGRAVLGFLPAGQRKVPVLGTSVISGAMAVHWILVRSLQFHSPLKDFVMCLCMQVSRREAAKGNSRRCHGVSETALASSNNACDSPLVRSGWIACLAPSTSLGGKVRKGTCNPEPSTCHRLVSC